MDNKQYMRHAAIWNIRYSISAERDKKNFSFLFVPVIRMNSGSKNEAIYHEYIQNDDWQEK